MAQQPQRFAVSRGKDNAFRPGFRSYFHDRDLGLREATGGRFMAEVHRASGPCPAGGSGLHAHRVDFQFNYLLKGWCRMEFEGEGEFTFEVGDTWLQPSGIRHNFLACSDDCEILEIVSPGTFETVDA
jgi:mannose-6-phosphate isomerase-like protein (cupin superfamily)